MNRGVIRSTLRRQIRDTQSVEWDDDNEVNELINIAYAYVQKEIAKSFPEAHLYWTYENLVAGTNWYPMPSTFGISQINMKGAATDTFYNTLKGPKRYRDIGPRTVFSGGTQIAQPSDLNSTYWTIRGQWFGLFPTPATSITSGIEIIHTPIMTLSDDNEIPRIKTPLHMAILWWAKLLLLGDTDESVQETRARLNEVLSDIPLWYDNQRGEPDQLIVGF